jgi:hypothetical protein
MILYKREGSSWKDFRTRLGNEPYIIINLIFAGIIVLIFTYSGIFSPEKNNYPVVCIHEKLTGIKCPSCGLSHSFSLIVRGRFDEAHEWNENGMRIFLFFASQLIMRIVFSVFRLKYASTGIQLVIYDCIGSGVIFLVSFWPLITAIATGYFN